MISIFSLIYRSPTYADLTWDSLHEHTPHLHDGRAEFFFVANDPEPALVEHLDRKRYPYHLWTNERLTEAQLFAMGYGRPEYLHRVYRAQNRGLELARGELVVVTGSDFVYSDGWLDALLEHDNGRTAVVSQLVEWPREPFGIFPGAYSADFGDSPATFDHGAWAEYAQGKRKDGTREGGAYQPMLLRRDWIEKWGGFPEGNFAGGCFDEVICYGDQAFVMKLASHGIDHRTALGSVVYHWKEGERSE